jgi:hypothetical protein
MEQLRGDIFIEHQQTRPASLTAAEAVGYSALSVLDPAADGRAIGGPA